MEVILKEDVEKLGEKHDIIKVKNGFGRNYLIPKRLAILANDSNRRILAEDIRVETYREQKRLSDVDTIIDVLKGAIVHVTAKVGENNKLFGSVTSQNIADAIKEQTKIELSKKIITIIEDVKSLGTYKAKIDIKKDFTFEITFEVLAEEGPEPVAEEKPKEPKEAKESKAEVKEKKAKEPAEADAKTEEKVKEAIEDTAAEEPTAITETAEASGQKEEPASEEAAKQESDEKGDGPREETSKED
ncbi:MAG: 50S ribosomal protein L9 [Bacteroidetes bacterium]|nr:50S ribosomal protein L9 [Bacteroidota bacterium]